MKITYAIAAAFIFIAAIDATGGMSTARANDSVPRHVLCIDADRDGYGVACDNGADADDANPDVNSINSMSQLHQWMDKRGYSPEVMYFVCPDGDDATAAAGDINRPFATVTAAGRRLRPGACLVFREGRWAGKNMLAIVGMRAPRHRPVLVIAMPGERPTLQSTGSCIEIRNSGNIIIDGLVLTTIDGGGHGVKLSQSGSVRLRNLEIFGLSRGIFGSQGLGDVTISSCVVRDNGGSHGIYLGSRDKPNRNILIENCLIYRNAMHGIQHNGRVMGMTIEGNSIHSNTHGGISLLQGVCSSVIRNNIIFNNNKQAIILHCYDDKPNSGIVAYDQNDNLVEDNILWVGRYDWRKGSDQPASHAAVQLSDATARQDRRMNNNIFRRNIITTFEGPAILFGKLTLAAETVFEDNVIYRSAGPHRLGECHQQWYTIKTLGQITRRFEGNHYSRPAFRDVSVTYSDDPTRFDFHLPTPRQAGD